MKNHIIRAKCIDMTFEGQGVCRYDNLVIFVKSMIIDEEADIKIIAVKKNYAIGIIDKLIVPSKHRIDSICKIAYKCGGCDFRHIDYDYQLVLKKKILEDVFKEYQVLDVIKDDNPYYYRNKVQVPIKDNKIGFYRKYSNDIVEFDDCYIETELANRILKDLKKLIFDYQISTSFRHLLIKHSIATDEVMLAFIANNLNVKNINELTKDIINLYPNIKSVILNLNDKDTNVILGEKEIVLYGRDYIYDEFNDIKVKISLKSFYQVNHGQMLKLYDQIIKAANISKDDNVLDLYSGIGTISLYLAKHSKHVTGVEIVNEAVENAKENIKLNNIDNVDFVLADASKGMNKYLKDKDIVVVDPPRKGLSNELINELIQNKIKKIVYVSCNPLTLNRDLMLFKDKYNISSIQPVDMFPFTHHVETVVLMSRKA